MSRTGHTTTTAQRDAGSTPYRTVIVRLAAKSPRPARGARAAQSAPGPMRPGQPDWEMPAGRRSSSTLRRPDHRVLRYINRAQSTSWKYQAHRQATLSAQCQRGMSPARRSGTPRRRLPACRGNPLTRRRLLDIDLDSEFQTVYRPALSIMSTIARPSSPKT